MFAVTIISFVLFSVIAGNCALKRLIFQRNEPDYIPACRQTDPNLNQCALKNARKALPFILKGDPSYQIPNMAPFHVSHVGAQPSHNMQLNLTDLYIFGLPDIHLLSVKVNLKSSDISVSAILPILSLVSHYSIKGKLQILPIEGDGPSNITFVNVSLSYHLHFTLQPKKNVTYAILTHHDLDFKCEKANYHFEHLFNGNKQLGDTVSDFMEHNWRAVHRDMAPLITEAIDAIITSIVDNLLHKVPYDDLFLP